MLSPTVVVYPNFDEKADAQKLRDGMKASNDSMLIDVLCRRSNTQRLIIEKAYKTMFGKDLVKDIKSATSGNFQRVLVALLMPLEEYLAELLYEAMAGLGTDEQVLIELLCTSSNYVIKTVGAVYSKLYKHALEDDIKSDTSGHFKRLLVSMCQANRSESTETDPRKAREDAAALYAAGEEKLGTDESTFNMILCERNYAQLRMIFDEYEVISNNKIEKAIESEFSGDVRTGLLTIVQCVRSKVDYFAQILHKSMKGLGTNDKRLIRAIVTRCEVDMFEIKKRFEVMYGGSLKSWIEDDTSGSYKNALLTLIQEN